MIMKKTTTLIALAALVVVGAILLPSSAMAANGACGGGNTLSQVIKGWQKHRVLDDVARSTGQTPGLDGSSRSIVKGGIVKTIVVRGGWVTNYTCTGGKFKKVPSKKYIPAGSIYWVPEKLAPAPCKKKRTKRGYEARCGNKQVGSLLVKRPCKKKPSKPKPPKSGGPKVVCSNTGQVVNSVDQCVVQTNSAEQNCKAIVGGTWNGTQCSIEQTNNNCSNQANDNSGTVNQGGNCNVTNVCSNVNSPGATVDCDSEPPTCPDGSPVPPDGTCDRPPTIQNDGQTAHTMVGDWRYIWFIVTDPDGDSVDSFNIVGTSPYAHIAGIISVTVLGSNNPCPANSRCFRATLWADYVPSGTTSVQAQFTAIASAGGLEATPLPLSFTIIPVIP